MRRERSDKVDTENESKRVVADVQTCVLHRGNSTAACHTSQST